MNKITMFILIIASIMSSSANAQAPKRTMLDMSNCFNGNALPTAANNVVIGLNAGANMPSGKCNILIGDNTQIPEEPTSYFLNIGNRICMDIRTQERLPCPTDPLKK